MNVSGKPSLHINVLTLCSGWMRMRRLRQATSTSGETSKTRENPAALLRLRDRLHGLLRCCISHPNGMQSYGMPPLHVQLAI